MKLYATVAQGLENWLLQELQALGAQSLEPGNRGVTFLADTATTYRILLWSRVASRILLPLTRIAAPDTDTLYRHASAIRWDRHLFSDGRFAIEVSAHQASISHSQHAALRLKDAIVDQFRARYQERPSVDLENPGVRIHLWLRGDRAQLSIDLSGPLSHRGYRQVSVAAPLRETLAAGLLLQTGWPALAAQGGGLFDPLCGSGTLLIEGAWMAANIAPGLLRARFGSPGWKRFDAALWQSGLQEAEQQRLEGLSILAERNFLLGRDQDPVALEAARRNVQAAGLDAHIRLECAPLTAPLPAQLALTPGLVLTNPPYGERLGERATLHATYRELGVLMHDPLPHWRLALLTAHPELADAIPLPCPPGMTLQNGPLPVRLLQFPAVRESTSLSLHTEGARALANRLRKNFRHLQRWAEREGISCWRLYDADLPEYALAVDIYHAEDGLRWAHVQEYAPPRDIDPHSAQRHLEEALPILREVLAVPAQRLVLKRRERQSGTRQYERHASTGRFLTVREDGVRLQINLWDHLDTGLFLDHRLTRARVATGAAQRSLLNLFCYTASASVLAACAGAQRTLSVDLSRPYLEWAAANFRLNGIEPGRDHRLLQADVRAWLQQADHAPERYAVIFLDPPSFSNSKRMQGVLDVQRDHVELIEAALKLLEPQGELIFSTHLRHFRLDREALQPYRLEDWSRATLPEDFRRNPRIHQCWRITP